jgi:hypothetical protein
MAIESNKGLNDVTATSTQRSLGPRFLSQPLGLEKANIRSGDAVYVFEGGRKHMVRRRDGINHKTVSSGRYMGRPRA